MQNEKKTYGYLRVSTDKQDLQGNKSEILLKANELKLGNVEFIEEIVSGGKDWSNRKLGELFEKCNKGDVIITSEISRIGRSINPIMEFIAGCARKDIKLYFTKNDLIKVDGSIQSQMLIFAYSLSAQIERELIITRTKAGMKRAKEAGKQIGRKQGISKLDKHKEEIIKMLNEDIRHCAIAKKFNCTKATFSKYIKVHKLKPITIKNKI